MTYFCRHAEHDLLPPLPQLRILFLYRVVLRVDALGAPALEHVFQPGFAFAVLGLVVGLFDPGFQKKLGL